MCLGVPGKVLDIADDGPVRMGRVSFDGVARNVCLEYVQDAVPGDYVLVHVGFALSKIDETEARRVFELLRELSALDDESAAPADEEPAA